MKRMFVFMLTVLLLAGMFSGCGTQTPEQTLQTDVQEGRFTFPTLPAPSINYPMDETEGDATEPTEELPIQPDVLETVTNVDELRSTQGDLRYVMIYNPDIYDENKLYNMTLTTGDFSEQVNVDLGRADGLTALTESLTIGQDELNDGIPFDAFDLDGDRAGGIVPVYEKGDTKTFYTYSSFSMQDPRQTRSFSCRYAGMFCNVWVYGNSISDEQAAEFGAEFDGNVYMEMVLAFGAPRYADEGGKVNLLYYPMPKSLGGCFCMLDLYASNEVTPEQITQYGVNTDHAIVHLNADLAAREDKKVFMTSTLAHEFQHLICGTNYFYTVNYTHCRSWFNEAMSGYVEEMIFPGSKLEGGHLDCYMASNRIRHGQSLYNFDITNTQTDFDIGVYGSVYLYAEYLDQLAGQDVFSNFHYYWRNSYSTTLSEAEALVNSVSPEIYELIDQSITYPEYMFFDTSEEAWMSKLTLQFYLELMDQDEWDPEAFAHIQKDYLLYDEINPANIEGGGRIIIALEGDSYQIPADADTDLIYIGLDENFQVVTPLVYR